MLRLTHAHELIVVVSAWVPIIACSAGGGGSSSSSVGDLTTVANTSGGARNSSPNATGGVNPWFAVSDAGVGGVKDTHYVPEQWPPKACVNVITEHPDASSDRAGEGAYCQGPSVTSATEVSNSIQDSAGCGTVLWGIARDFIDRSQSSCTKPVGAPHPDFGVYCCGNPLGTVLSELGDDGKPVYNPANVTGNYSAGGVGLTGKTEFDQWYRDTPGINVSYLVGFDLVPSGDGNTRIFSSRLYYPLDGAGYDVSNCVDRAYGTYGNDGKQHNFRFTTELHTKFKYLGGEVFSFFGDDDVWVFINNKLALDLGGVHSRMSGTVDLDKRAHELGLTTGQVYNMDLFQAERFGSESNFEISTSMTFVDCGIDPSVIVN